MSLVKLEHISAIIGDKTTLSDISLEMSGDQVWAVVGANACGKSSLGRLLCGELEVLSGDLRLPARCEYVSFEKVSELLDHEAEIDNSDYLGTFDHGTRVRDYISGDSAIEDCQLTELSAELNLAGLLDQGLKTLSTGEMRKVVISRALLQKPDLLVLDEPFDGLDVDSVQVLRKVIAKTIATGIRVVLVLNRFDDILPEISHIAYLQDCRLLLAGPKDELLGSAALRRLHAFHHTLPARLPGERDEKDCSADRLPPIEMTDVMVRYGDKPVLNGLDWTVRPGENWAVAGPNGSGKTTLLQLITGDNVQGYGNNIRLFGRPKGSGESIWEVKERLGYVSTALQQSYRVGISAKLTIISGFYDSIGLYRSYSREQERIALEWLEILHLERQRNAPFRSLSYGEQRLLLIARAMVKSPALLILDEPCQGLDDANREMVLKLVDHLGRGGQTQIIYVSHRQRDWIPCIGKTLRLVPAEGGGFKGRVEVV